MVREERRLVRSLDLGGREEGGRGEGEKLRKGILTQPGCVWREVVGLGIDWIHIC